CGVDGTEESRAAVAQVGRLIEASGGESHVVLVSVWNTGASVAVGWSPGIARTGSFPEAELRAAAGGVPGADGARPGRRRVPGPGRGRGRRLHGVGPRRPCGGGHRKGVRLAARG